ncbi:hypothetical protein M3148_02700 [Georgenia satyanarayanai]|uniref:DUF7224 domain-containing protein n=1 Tax=Georgenia satyanarayanai TaxID=860221 RepID=UPI00203BF38A|nr:hypothetical protein [Georgenia satyanarayanai]MCM3659908.1 hypothetical protein [Georgenia satyanarayanai]
MNPGVIGLGRLTVLAAAVAVVVALCGSVLGLTPSDLRGVSLTTTATFTLIFIVPIVATAGAFAGATQRRIAGSLRSGVRHPARSALSVAAAQAMVGLFGVVLAAVIVMATEDAWVLPHLPLLGVAALSLTAASLTGQALGRFVPVVIAAPLLLALGYVVMAVPAAMSSPLWLRHLFLVEDCCSPEHALAPQVLIAQTILWGSLAVGALIMTLRRLPRVALVAASVVVVVVGAQLAAVQVDDFDWSPTVPRTSELSCAQSDGVEVCVWPEHDEALDGLLTAAHEVARVGETYDLTVPSSYSEDTTSGAAPLVVHPDHLAQSDLAAAISMAIPGDPTRCEAPDGGIPGELVNAWYLLTSWWVDQTTGTPRPDLEAMWAKDYLTEATDTAARVRDLTAAIETCDPTMAPAP